MAVMRHLDWRAAGLGAAVTLGILQPPVQIINALKTNDRPGEESFLWIVAALAFFVAFPIGGFYAARRRPRTPFLHGAVAAAIALVATLVIRTIVDMITGDDSSFSIITTLLLAQIAISLGVLGAYASTVRKPRRA